MQKGFDKWNEIKKYIDASGDITKLFPKEGEVWMCLIGKNVGFEQNGGGDNFSRAVLIIKKFNNKMFWMVPLSTKQKKFDFYYNFIDLSDRKVSVILAQMRLISVKRLKRKLYDLPDKDFDNIKQKIKNFIV